MVDYLIHFYRKGSPPFRSLSLLPEESALSIMRRLYIKGSAFWERFSDPCGYLAERKKVETALYEGFVGKGGAPRTRHPLYLVLGRPKWTERVADPATLATSDELLVPLHIIPRDVISFTYPDSMVSAFMVEQKKPEYYEPEYRGKRRCRFIWPTISRRKSGITRSCRILPVRGSTLMSNDDPLSPENLA